MKTEKPLPPKSPEYYLEYYKAQCRSYSRQLQETANELLIQKQLNRKLRAENARLKKKVGES